MLTSTWIYVCLRANIIPASHTLSHNLGQCEHCGAKSRVWWVTKRPLTWLLIVDWPSLVPAGCAQNFVFWGGNWAKLSHNYRVYAVLDGLLNLMPNEHFIYKSHIIFMRFFMVSFPPLSCDKKENVANEMNYQMGQLYIYKSMSHENCKIYHYYYFHWALNGLKQSRNVNCIILLLNHFTISVTKT